MSTSKCQIEELTTEAYEAELNAEMEKLKAGDRSVLPDSAASSTAASTAAAADSPAAAASSTTADAAESSDASSSATSGEEGDSSSLSGSSSAPIHIEEIVEKDLTVAIARKTSGNLFFARQQYPQAIEEYSQAIALCPSGDGAAAEAKEHMATFLSNRAAAFLMQSQYTETISDCSASLALHPSNPKALGRRARAHEALDQLAEAVEDLKALVALDPQDRDSARNLARVEKMLNEKNEKMKAEMLDKLKGFGNTILGKFGMSLDNFKATQDPATGSYNISFGK